MRHWTPRTFALVLVLAAGLAGASRSAPSAPRSKEAPAAPADLNELSMEVAALTELHRLQLTAAQLQLLAQAGNQAAREEARQPGKASPRYRATLIELRAALVRGDEDRIGELHDRLVELEDEDTKVEDGVEVTAKVRSLAVEFLPRLTPRQVLGCLAEREDVPDLTVSMLTAMIKGRALNAEAWKELRDETAEEAANLLAGVREAEHKRVVEQVGALLEPGRRSKDTDLLKLKRDTEAAVARLVGNRGPLDLLRNVVERDLAELFSNPRFPAAVQALLAGKR